MKTPGAPELKHPKRLKRVLLGVIVLAGVSAAFGAFLVFGWMMDETHFGRPDPQFDRLTAQLEEMPGVSIDSTERWVEAPTFSDPTAWIQLSVDQAHLPGLISTACASEYTDDVAWSIRVPTDNGSVVSLYSTDLGDTPVDGTPCPDFGFDAVGVVAEVGTSLPDLNLQASIWDNSRFSLASLDDPDTLSALLPLVEHAEDVRDAAGLDRRESVEVSGMRLDVVIPSGEHEQYLALLSALVHEREVTSFFGGGGGTPIDGVEKVQIVAPDEQHSGIKDAVRTSGLDIADLPVRFIPVTPSDE